MPTGLDAQSSTLECDPASCDIHLKDCPADSFFRGPLVIPGQCGPPESDDVCQCLPCLSDELACPQGHIKVLVSAGNGAPGSCCDIYECHSKGELFFCLKCEFISHKKNVSVTPEVTCLGSHSVLLHFCGHSNDSNDDNHVRSPPHPATVLHSTECIALSDPA
jgi:hypothetical protein